ncbi:hypothetical protein, partial [Streptomyces globisporus]|uniref:hypothetical protein n=1 Tax=Streptomyces globisporus TaxID=1908 RepID=UPI0014048826
KDLIEVYTDMMRAYTEEAYRSELIDGSNIVNHIDQRFDKLADRVTGMLGRTGMDVSIVVVGLLNILSKDMDIRQDRLYEELRKSAAEYYSRPYQKKKDERQ